MGTFPSEHGGNKCCKDHSTLYCIRRWHIVASKKLQENKTKWMHAVTGGALNYSLFWVIWGRAQLFQRHEKNQTFISSPSKKAEFSRPELRLPKRISFNIKKRTKCDVYKKTSTRQCYQYEHTSHYETTLRIRSSETLKMLTQDPGETKSHRENTRRFTWLRRCWLASTALGLCLSAVGHTNDRNGFSSAVPHIPVLQL